MGHSRSCVALVMILDGYRPTFFRIIKYIVINITGTPNFKIAKGVILIFPLAHSIVSVRSNWKLPVLTRIRMIERINTTIKIRSSFFLFIIETWIAESFF